IAFRGEDFPIQRLCADAFSSVEIVLSSTPASVSRQWSPVAAAAGAVVVDNSSAFRMEPQVPLVVPEVNPRDILKHRGIIANPNCSTIQMVVALKPLHDAARVGGALTQRVDPRRAGSSRLGRGGAGPVGVQPGSDVVR